MSNFPPIWIHIPHRIIPGIVVQIAIYWNKPLNSPQNGTKNRKTGSINQPQREITSQNHILPS